jgi:hypothetical protein
VLGKFSDEVKGAEYLEITLGPGDDPVAVVVGEGPARVLFGFIDDLAGICYLNQSRKAERAARDVLNQSLDADFIAGGQVHRLVYTEAGMLPGTHILDDNNFFFPPPIMLKYEK